MSDRTELNFDELLKVTGGVDQGSDVFKCLCTVVYKLSGSQKNEPKTFTIEKVDGQVDVTKISKAAKDWCDSVGYEFIAVEDIQELHDDKW